jgi:ferredoxin, 2Fe-2S
MAVISIPKSGKSVQVPAGSNLMKALLDAGLPVASSCGGDGVCSKCHVVVIAGKENLSKETQEEQDLREINDIPKGSRISCQVIINGDVSLDTPYW